MPGYLRTILCGCSLFAFVAITSAQNYDGPYRQYPPSDRYRDGYRGGPYGYGGYSNAPASPVDRALYDLSRAGRSGYLDHHERKHLEHAQDDLARFQERWSQGRFDTGRLDSAIDNIKHLVNADQMRPPDRNILARDLADLRAFRANRGRSYGFDEYRYRH